MIKAIRIAETNYAGLTEITAGGWTRFRHIANVLTRCMDRRAKTFARERAMAARGLDPAAPAGAHPGADPEHGT